MRIGSLAFAAALVVSAAPALAGWQYDEGGAAADGSAFVAARVNDAGHSSLAVICAKETLYVSVELEGFASLDEFDNIQYSFDREKAISDTWNVAYLTLLEIAEPGSQQGSVHDFARKLAQYSTLTASAPGTKPATFSLKGSSGPIHKVLAACE